MVPVPQRALAASELQLRGASNKSCPQARGSNWIHDSLEVVETADCGYGVVANAPIHAGTLVVMFGGVVITGSEFEELPVSMQHFPFQVSDDLFLGPRDETDIGVGERINHSCSPTVGFSGAIALVALRNIAKGEPITLDYATCVASNDDAFRMDCQCGAPQCRKTITGHDWRIPEVQDRLFPYFQPFIQAKVRALEARQPKDELRQLSVVRNDDRVLVDRAARDVASSPLRKVGTFLRDSLREEWMAIPICIIAGIPSTLCTTAIMAIVAPWLRYLDFAKSEAVFISAVSLLSSVVGYGTYLIAYYAGMLWKERDDWFANGRVVGAGLRRKVRVIQYDFLAHLPSDVWVMPLMGAATGSFFVAGASQFWSILLAHTMADVAYAIKEPFFWHGAKEVVAWQEGRAATSSVPATKP